MAITNGYTTLALAKAALGISDSTEDTALESAIEDASRAIDDDTGRLFYLVTPAVARTFTADAADLCFIDDMVTLSSIKTDQDGDRVYETTWASTDYDLLPANKSPKTRIQIALNGTRAFPTHHGAVEVTATWGYATVPNSIARACLIQAIRFYKRKDVPFGAMGSMELGFARIPVLDPDVKARLEPYRRIDVGVV